MSSRAVAIANAYLDAGLPDDAIATLGPELVEDPDDLDLLCTAARAEMERDRRTEAHHLLRHARALHPDAEWPCRLLAVNHLGQNHREQARRFAYEARRLDPGAWQTHYMIAAVAMGTGWITHHDRTAIRTAMQLEPMNPDVLTLGACFAFWEGKRRRGRALLREALRIDPGHEGALGDLGQAMLRWRPGAALAIFFPVALTRPDERWAAGVEAAVGSIVLRASLTVLLATSVTLWSGGAPTAGRAVFQAVAVVITLLLTAGPVELDLRRGGALARRATIAAMRANPGLATWASFTTLSLTLLVAAGVVGALNRWSVLLPLVAMLLWGVLLFTTLIGWFVYVRQRRVRI